MVAECCRRAVVMPPVTVNGDVTVRVAEPVTAPDVAVTVVTPGKTLVAKPAPVTVATAVADEVHATPAVSICELLSVYVPVAVNCCVRPAEIEGFAGITAIDTSAGAVTIKVVEAVTEPEAAPIVVLPCASAAASPEEPIVAAAVFEELHATALVISRVVPSVRVPVAANCLLRPAATDGFAGAIVSDTNRGAVTERVAEPLIEPALADTVALPRLADCAKP